MGPCTGPGFLRNDPPPHAPTSTATSTEPTDTPATPTPTHGCFIGCPVLPCFSTTSAIIPANEGDEAEVPAMTQ